MLTGLLSAAASPMGQQFIRGIGGFLTGRKGDRQLNQAMQMPSEQQLRNRFSGTQGIIDQMSYTNAMSPVMDLASMQGNQAVQDSMMMGIGGSQGNALRARLQNNAAGQLYGAYQQNLGNQAQLQMGIDSNIANQMAGNQAARSQMLFNRGGINQAAGSQALGDALGSIGVLAADDPNALGAFGKNIFRNTIGQDGIGGMLGQVFPSLRG